MDAHTAEPRLRIRTANISDAARIAAVSARLFYHTFAPDNRPEDMALYMAAAFGEAQQRRELQQPRTQYLMMHADDALIGIALLIDGSTNPRVHGAATLEIQRFYVDPVWHGRGAARQLMNACVSIARSLGADTVWLGVWEMNSRAIRFYEKCGFVDAGTLIFQLGTDAQTDRIMMRSVDVQRASTPSSTSD